MDDPRKMPMLRQRVFCDLFKANGVKDIGIVTNHMLEPIYDFQLHKVQKTIHQKDYHSLNNRNNYLNSSYSDGMHPVIET
ncbi:hypothetical protein L1987_49807 [Smallanthus sonchifolius]|uniref:Uncharacterized protein n=1 Tax=Smallanthus sonchifolius TaxID=185202 RepID=A0ACB9FV99_9ASTR|nr:hypothetical protein L1987_49807 [Smallanthus sonchifolius]